MKRGVLIALLVIVIMFVFIILAAGFIYMQLTQEPVIPDNAYLKINLAGNMEDFSDSFMTGAITIKDLYYHLNRAKIDPRIKGVILKISYLNTGLAKCADAGNLLRDFAESGKPVVAYIEAGGIREYFLGSFADQVFTFKGGDLFLRGLASEAIFLRSTLSKLGISADMLHIGEYKTAADMFTKDKMTPYHREALQTLLDDVFESTLEQIAQNRDIELKDVKAIFQQSPYSTEAYLKAKLIDGSIYEDEIFEKLDGTDKTVDFRTYRETTTPIPFAGPQKIAVIFASGEIQVGNSGGKSLLNDKTLGSDTLVRQLRAVRKNKSVAAVVLRVDSPGGSALASEVMRRETELLAKEKPLVISMADLAASGGYWISMSSNKIFASPQTLTGSIGVVSGKFVLKDMYSKIGLKKEILKTTEYADIFSDYKKFTPAEREKIVDMMHTFYNKFISLVAKNRQMKTEEVDSIARGRVWSGSRALTLKLVDQMGGLTDAIAEARNLAKIPEEEKTGIVIYPKEKSFFEYLMGVVQAKIENPMAIDISAQLEKYKKFFPALILPYQVNIY
jgi:protease-4